jgi:tetratricopeptide (TPR) repeat protein
MLALVATAVLAVDAPEMLHQELEEARDAYDAEAAAQVLGLARQLEGDSEQIVELRVRAALALAELLRIELETGQVSGRGAERQVGQRIDAVAEEALSLLEELPESSERWRLKADLIATMIRSDYRAQRWEDELRAAIDRALELDPDNPHAVVAAAKPLLFAPLGRGRDPERALEQLERALELEPGLEDARLLRARALELVGQTEAARQVLGTLVEDNPDCQPAAYRLRELTRD